MDLNDFHKQVGTRDKEDRFSLETPTRLSSWQAKKLHQPAAWKDVLENPSECRNPILLSESGQRVIRAIRQIHASRQPMNNKHTPKQGRSSYRISFDLVIS